MTELDKIELELINRELASRDLLEFIKYTFRGFKYENWHHKIVSNFFDKIMSGEIKRAMVFMPPRHGKTETEERAIAKLMGANKDAKVMVCAYGSEKSVKISEHIKDTIKDNRFKNVFPNSPGIRAGSDQKHYWQIEGSRGSLLATGVGGAITGEGFNIGVIDDPVKSREEAESPRYQEKTLEWYNGTFLTRQDEEDSSIVITNTRWNRKDLCGLLLEKDGIKSYNGKRPGEGCPEWNGSENGVWEILCLPAILDAEFIPWKHEDDPRKEGEALWENRYSADHLKQFLVNRYDWDSQFQQRPRPRGGNIINREWFNIVEENQVPRSKDVKYVRFWDLAGTPKEEKKKNDPDWTAGALLAFHNNHIYILDIQARQDSPNKVEQLIIQTAELDDQRFSKVKQYWEEEGGAGGKHVTEHYKKVLSNHLREPYKVGKNKEFYIDLFANKAETGQISLVKGKWLNDVCDGNTFLDEAEEFPKGRHDDRIDAVAKACHILTGKPVTLLDALSTKQGQNLMRSFSR